MRTSFSIIVPTYSGLATIDKTFRSILSQSKNNLTYEVIVVIDGPSAEIRRKAENFEREFTAKLVPFKIEQFKNNKGRYEARLAGAKTAKNPQLLFIDDRAKLAEDFFLQLSNINHSFAIPNVVEMNSPNIMSKTLSILRRRIYGNRVKEFEDYLINLKTFEKSPKGTTCLWTEKTVFIKACEKFNKSTSKNTKYVNEDTRILKAIVDTGNTILRTSKLNIYYQPRSGFNESIKHLYDRGPRFVDYYARPGTRFFPLLLVIYAVALLLIVTAVIKPPWLHYYLTAGIIGLLVLGILLTKNIKEFLIFLIGLPLIFLIFSAGVIKGSLIKMTKK